MVKEDFKNFTKDEIVNIFVDFVNFMKTDVEKYHESSINKNVEDDFISEYYGIYSAALMTKVNYINNLIIYENNKKSEKINGEKPKFTLNAKEFSNLTNCLSDLNNCLWDGRVHFMEGTQHQEREWHDKWHTAFDEAMSILNKNNEKK